LKRKGSQAWAEWNNFQLSNEYSKTFSNSLNISTFVSFGISWNSRVNEVMYDFQDSRKRIL
jgi:hypothetical protein